MLNSPVIYNLQGFEHRLLITSLISTYSALYDFLLTEFLFIDVIIHE